MSPFCTAEQGNVPVGPLWHSLCCLWAHHQFVTKHNPREQLLELQFPCHCLQLQETEAQPEETWEINRNVTLSFWNLHIIPLFRFVIQAGIFLD